MKNKLVLDFRDNPDLKTALSGKQPGDSVKLEVELMVTSVDEETFEGDIESITTDDEDGEPATSKTDAESPVMAVMVAKKSTGSAKDESESEDDSEETDESA